MTIAIIIALLLGGGGGVSFVAENSLPGDILYPIKIHVNENAREFAAVSDEAEAKVQAKLAERRIEETEKLAVSGRLNAETSADLKVRFEEHSKKSKASLAKMNGEDRVRAETETNGDFEVSLMAHEQILADMEASDPQISANLIPMLASVRLNLSDVSNARISAETKALAAKPNTKEAAEGALKSAENKITEVRKFFESKKDKLNAGAQTEATDRLYAADSMVAAGKVKMEAQAYADAFALFKKAAREAQTAKLFVTASQNLYVHKDVSTGSDDNMIACPQDAMICPDGSGVGRTGPNCEFVCPGDNDNASGGGGSDSGGGVVVEPDDSTTVACTRIYAPVCGINGVTFSNSCTAKAARVTIAYSGECSDSGGQDIACTMDAKICPDGSAVGRTGPDCEFAECPAPISQGDECRTDRDCDSGYECIDPSPVVREGYPGTLRCWKIGAPHPICLSGNTKIATPNGKILVKNISEGMNMWTVDKNGKKVAGTVILAGKTRVPSTHKVMHIKLSDGRELFVSPGHKIADGRSAGKIVLGDTVDGATVILSSLVPYTEKYTYDILASGETGMYFANDILLQSTLK